MSKLELLTEEVRTLNRKVTRNNVISGLKVVAMLVMAAIVLWQMYIMFLSGKPNKSESHIAVIKLSGVIESGARYGDGLALSKTLHDAAEAEGSKAIIIQANSGGGAPVQAEIFNEALTSYLNSDDHKPVYFVIEEVCASACMYIAAAIQDQKLLAHKNSLIGSIGVKLETFGFVDIMNKVGVERRSYTIGDNKAFLDPFQPEDEFVKEHINKKLLLPLFNTFKSVIVEGRGDKLSDDPRVISGLVWAGNEAVELGLIDGTTTTWKLRQQLSEEFQTDQFVTYNEKSSKITDLFKAEFWSEVLMKLVMKKNDSIEVRY